MKRPLLLLAGLVCAGSAGAAAVKVVRNSPALQFTYAFPAEAAAIPALKRRFEVQMARDFRKALKLGLENQKVYKQQKREGARDFYAMEWSTAGQTPRLLSLQNEISTFTGGAHPNTGYGALLWDRRSNGAISVESLFLRSGAFAAQTRIRYCAGLEAERKKRRGRETMDLPDFNQCPKPSDLAVSPLDTNHNGRFDSFAFVASPYTAGPYAEGEYDIQVPVSSQMINAIKPEFRNAFERHRQ